MKPNLIPARFLVDMLCPLERERIVAVNSRSLYDAEMAIALHESRLDFGWGIHVVIHSQTRKHVVVRQVIWFHHFLNPDSILNERL